MKKSSLFHLWLKGIIFVVITTTLGFLVWAPITFLITANMFLGFIVAIPVCLLYPIVTGWLVEKLGGW